MDSIKKNRMRLIPGVGTYWGDIAGNISEQTDLVDYISSHAGGSAVWGSITGNLSEQVDLMEKFSSYATLSDIPSLEGYATESWVSDQGYLTSSALEGYATESWVTESLSSYALLSDIPSLEGYATESWVSGQGYITSSALEGYATESFVTEQGYITSSALSSYATQSWVSSQNYVSDKAPYYPIDNLKYPTGNQLYTNIYIRHTTIGKNDFGIVADFEATRYFVNVPYYIINQDSVRANELWYLRGQNVYRFDSYDLMFVKQATMEQYADKPIWQDHTGRLYIGDSYMYNPTAPDYSCLTSITLCPDGGYYWNFPYDNMVYTQNNIYLFSSNRVLKFDEENQVFEDITVTGSEYATVEFGQNYFVYEGHYLYIDNWTGTMYEFDEDNLSINIVSTPYFNVSVGGDYINSKMVRTLGSDYYYFKPGTRNVYKLRKTGSSAGNWTSVTMQNHLGDYNFDEYRNLGVVSIQLNDGSWKYFCLGGYDSYNSDIIPYVNPTTSDINISSWQNPGRLCVDLQSEQTISGTKRFNQITASTIQVTGALQGTDLSASFSKIQGTLGNVNLTANTFILNDKIVATTDQCILNRVYGSYGKYFTSVTGSDWERGYNAHFITYNGRMFKVTSDSIYEFTGSAWVESLTFNNRPMYGSTSWKVVNTTTATFMCRDGSTYIFDNSSTDFVYICDGDYDLWTCGSTIRGGQDYKLVESGGTYSWVEDMVVDYKGFNSVICNSNVYVFGNDGTVYQYDESLKSYTALGYFDTLYPINCFVCNNEMFTNNGWQIRKIDLSLVGVEDNISVDTDIYVTGNGSEFFYGEYDGKLYCYKNSENMFGYCYSLTETVPAVPDTNGTYVLKAVRTNSGVTYSWVLDEVAQAVQITNEILS